MKRYFVFKDDKSDKFWSIEVENNKFTTFFGKTGTLGNSSSKEFADEQEAKKEADKLIQEKTRKGYIEQFDEQIGKLGEAEFWNLIDRSRNKAEDTDEQVEILVDMLSKRSPEEIIAFQTIFDRLYTTSYQSDLWAAAYIINDGCSDDGFDYFRAWLIAKGKQVYYNALENPESLARVIKTEEIGAIECEDMLSAAGKAYEMATGADYDAFLSLLPKCPFPEIDLDWEEDELENKFPILWKKCCA